MQLLPNLGSKFVDAAGRLLEPFQSYLRQFTTAPPAFMDIDVTSSPFEYVAKETGYVAITGGTVTALVLHRGSGSINLSSGTNRLIPVSINDSLVITYLVLPTITFVASYGQNTTS